MIAVLISDKMISLKKRSPPLAIPPQLLTVSRSPGRASGGLLLEKDVDEEGEGPGAVGGGEGRDVGRRGHAAYLEGSRSCTSGVLHE